MSASKSVLGVVSVIAAAALAACSGSPMAPDAAPAVAAPAGDEGGVLTASTRGGEGGRGDGPIVWVTSQDLFYDSIVTADPLPPHGDFQKLEPGGDSGLMTQWGPGDRNYRGGRWWMDVNKNGEMDDGDHYFSCPLLGPGRSEP